ncbi:MAG: hypothetical protein WCI73_00805 [Phycisphaerae bacterium]
MANGHLLKHPTSGHLVKSCAGDVNICNICGVPGVGLDPYPQNDVIVTGTGSPDYTDPCKADGTYIFNWFTYSSGTCSWLWGMAVYLYNPTYGNWSWVSFYLTLTLDTTSGIATVEIGRDTSPTCIYRGPASSLSCVSNLLSFAASVPCITNSLLPNAGASV